MLKISQLKSRHDETDLGQVAAHLTFEGGLLCDETHVHVYPEGGDSFSVEWADNGLMDSEGRYTRYGTDYQATAQTILERLSK
jgi:hypothetical protein